MEPKYLATFGGDYTPLAHHLTFGDWILRDLRWNSLCPAGLVTSSKLISSKHKDEDCIPPRRDERFLSSPGGYLPCSPKKDTKQNIVFLLEVTLAFPPQNHLQLFVSSWLRCMNGMIKPDFYKAKIFFVLAKSWLLLKIQNLKRKRKSWNFLMSM